MSEQKHLSPEAGGRAVSIEGISKRFDTTLVLNDINIDIPAGQFTALLGPSGCGKSTLLRIIAGLERPSSGRITISGRDVTELPPADRDLGMVFQNYALFPHLNVAENIVFGLRVRGMNRAERDERLARAAKLVGLEGFLDRHPAALSGGQQQRVALARSVVADRSICLMDEPLSNLDAKLRAEMRTEIRALQKRLGLTLIYVTHDQVEAMTMADRIVVLQAGRIQQEATPRDLYETPQTAFVARFIGTPPMNLIPANEVGGPADQLLGIRPEDLTFSQDGQPARVIAQEYLGADLLVSLKLGQTDVILRQPARLAPPQTLMRLSWDPGRAHYFDLATGRRLPAPANSHPILRGVIT